MPKAPEKKLAPKSDTGTIAKNDEIEAYFIRSRTKSFRRCGHLFTSTGHGIEKSLLSDEQVKILMSDPDLLVEEVFVDATAITDKNSNALESAAPTATATTAPAAGATA